MLKKIVWFALIWTVFSSLNYCATRSAPSGGPVDRVPPVVLSTEPESNTTNIADLSAIRITFSERMDEGSLTKALFVSPPLEFDLNWKRGRRLEMTITDTLRPNQTYVVSIGSEASDSRRNRMESSLQFAFSTGNHIDEGEIAGNVYGMNRKETVTLFAYRLNNDTLFLENKPDYISQSGTEGQFAFNYMKTGTYRVFAVSDQNSNLLIDSDYERVGIPHRDVVLDSSRLMYRGLNLHLSRSDTLPPEALGARPIHTRYLQLRTSEPALLPKAETLMLKDSASSEAFPVLAVSRNIESGNTIDLFTAALDTSTYFLTVPGLSDSAGNARYRDTTLIFRGTDKTDTTHFTIITAGPADSARNHHPEDPLFIEFSNPVNWDSLSRFFSFTSRQGNPQAGRWHIRSAYDAEFLPATTLIPDSAYIFSLDVSKAADVWGNQLEDSLFSRYFTVVSDRELGEISGTVTAPGQASGTMYLNIRNIRQRDFLRRIQPDSTGRFLKRYLPEGAYRLDAFLDLDKNERYSPGSLFPFRFAEPFVFHPDTIKVRKRWETSGVRITLPETGSVQ